MRRIAELRNLLRFRLEESYRSERRDRIDDLSGGYNDTERS